MLEKVKSFVVGHKEQVIEGASTVVGTLIGLFIGMVITKGVNDAEEYLSDEEEPTEDVE